jgi:hypothetical protein
MRRSHTLSISIQRDYEGVYRFLADPRNYPKWSVAEAEGFAQLPNGDWQGDTTFGFRHFRFTPVNPYGVLDHAVFRPGEEALFTPMRVMPNQEATELIFVFFQRDGMSDEQFASSIEWITTDFWTLKSLLET